MLQPLGDRGKGQGGPRPRYGGGASLRVGEKLARPSATWGGERVPAPCPSAVAAAEQRSYAHLVCDLSSHSHRIV
eukprot:4259959-Amphidinium_carterae.1